jgi:hypothetical protein
MDHHKQKRKMPDVMWRRRDNWKAAFMICLKSPILHSLRITEKFVLIFRFMLCCICRLNIFMEYWKQNHKIIYVIYIQFAHKTVYIYIYRYVYIQFAQRVSRLFSKRWISTCDSRSKLLLFIEKYEEILVDNFLGLATGHYYARDYLDIISESLYARRHTHPNNRSTP